MKKVLYVLDQFPKISETFILNEITELIDRGIDVEILALLDPKEEITHEKVKDYKLIQKTKYLTPHTPRQFKLIAFFSKKIRRWLVQSNLFIDKQKRERELFSLAQTFNDIDLIHSHFAYEAAVIAQRLAKLSNKPMTFTAHAFEIYKKRFYSPARLKKLVKFANLVITPSQFNKDFIIKETNCQQDKIKIVRATISQKEFSSLTERSVIPHKIVTIGRLVEKKGFEYLIQSLKLVLEKYPQATLTIIGDGHHGTRHLSSLINHLKLTKHVTMLGSQTSLVCCKELLSAAIFVAPSITAKDGDIDVCPLVLQEAMALGLPVISTFSGSIPELIENGQSGILVAEKDFQALAQSIITIFENHNLGQELAKNGLERITNEFNIKQQVTKLLSLWDGVIYAR